MNLFTEFDNWQLNIHRLLGQGWGIEDIALKLDEHPLEIRDEVQELRKAGILMDVINKWAKPAIIYGKGEGE